MKYLKEAYRVISFDEYLDCPFLEDLDERKRCIVTFDDGWRDNYENAFSILKKYALPATVFIPTGYVNTDDWFWQNKLSWQIKKIIIDPILLSKIVNGNYKHIGLQYLKAHINMIKKPEHYLDIIIQRLKKCSQVEIDEIIHVIENFTGAIRYPKKAQVLNESEIIEMSRGGISFGSHGVSHRILKDLDEYDVDNEMIESRKYLEKKGFRYVPVIAYPNGNFSRVIQEKAKKQGYRAGVTTIPGKNHEDINMFELKRINIHNDISSDVTLFSFLLAFGGKC